MSDDDAITKTFGRATAKKLKPAVPQSATRVDIPSDLTALALHCSSADRATLVAALRDTARNYLTATPNSPTEALWLAACEHGWMERLDDIVHDTIHVKAFTIRPEGRPAIERLMMAWNEAAPLKVETPAEAYARLCAPFVRDLQGSPAETPRDRRELVALMAETVARLVEEAFAPREWEGILAEINRVALQRLPRPSRANAPL